MQYSLSYFLEVDKQPTVVDGNPSPNAIKLEEWRGLGANVDWLMSSGLVTSGDTSQPSTRLPSSRVPSLVVGNSFLKHVF